MKKIMILGGGKNQLPLCKEAKQMGYFVVTVGEFKGDFPCSRYSDKHYNVNYNNYEKLIEISKSEEIDGVISNSEPAMINVAKVATELKLPGNTPESVQKFMSKAAFRELQQECGVFFPKYFQVRSIEELYEKLNLMKYPVIIKPAQSSGTRGTIKIDKYDNELIENSFDACKEFSRNNMVSIEEYVPMNNLRVNDADIFVLDDEIMWDGLLWEDRSKDEPMLPMTEIYPLKLDDRELGQIKDTVNRLIRKSGVKHGEFNVETYFTPEHEVFVIEINPRQAGNYIPKLIEEHTGVNITKLLVTTSVGDMSYYNELKVYERENNFITLQVVFPKKSGIYKKLFISDEIRPYIQWIDHDIPENTKVEKGINATQAVAFVDMKFDSYETQHYFTDNIENYIYAEISEE